MGGEWRTVPLGQLIEPGRVLTYGIVQPGPPVSGGIPMVRVADIRDGRVSTADAVRISPAIEAPYGRSRLRGGELLLTVVGTVGETVVAPDSLAGWNTARGVAVIPIREDVGATWVGLALQGPEARGAIHSRLNTTVQPTLNLDDVARLPIAMPPIQERQRILRHIGALDDKIELNRSMSQTLEAMARALFKSWFVDFDPVRAKAEGRDTLLPAEIAALFPDTLEDSDLGEIPSGWEISSLGALCDRITDGSHSSPASVDRGRPMGSVKDMQRWGFDVKGCRQISEADYQRLVRDDCRPRAGDVLIAKDGSFLKHIFVAEDDLDLVVLSSIAILRPNARIGAHLLAFSLLDDATKERMSQYVSGAVLQRIVLKDFRQIPMLVPPTELQRAWAAAVTPIIRRCWRQLDESDALASMRDALVPALFGRKTTKAAQPGGPAVPS